MKLPAVEGLIATLVAQLRANVAAGRLADARVVGIRSGGVWVAERVRAELGLATPLGLLDISFHRDDYGRSGLNPTVGASQLPWDIGGSHVVLCDDVLYTGRTVRAALNEIFDWGRPASVALAVLVARDGRELPVQADAAGIALELGPHRHVKLRGPEPLRLELVEGAP
ncbi:MAG TPA: bifunctional pyr operon transcriptional regulator/uracil phosphoribosyltransferase PyrR [Xanthomonadales bacterium]|nr:bifunctional pyr operon transcriptional regulator/uracil phosphoribosyltransferase PyrR [Xanthomonadales bacterium]